MKSPAYSVAKKLDELLDWLGAEIDDGIGRFGNRSLGCEQPFPYLPRACASVASLLSSCALLVKLLNGRPAKVLQSNDVVPEIVNIVLEQFYNFMFDKIKNALSPSNHFLIVSL